MRFRAGAFEAKPSLTARGFTAAFLLAQFASFATGCGKRPGAVVFQREPGVPTDTQYGRTVEPIFRQDCYKCHNSSTHRGGLDMSTYAALMRGGKDGPVVIPWHSDRSLLLTLVRHAGPADHPMPMPPKSKLSDPEIQSIEQWIQQGATK